MYVLISWLVSYKVYIHRQHFFGAMRNNLQKQLVEMFCKKGVLRNFTKCTGKHLCLCLFFNKVAKKESLAQVFSCEFPEIFKSTFFTKHLWATASGTSKTKYLELIKKKSKVQEKNMSCKRALSVDHWKTFSKNYKLMRVWLWLVYKFTKNCRICQLSSEFI